MKNLESLGVQEINTKSELLDINGGWFYSWEEFTRAVDTTTSLVHGFFDAVNGVEHHQV
ncbi:hypothetical protein KUL156_49520 [Alteromonas sp. KUL156]|nr:hypothetical protein KUL154_02200 [Alteromonas sp. KUL154]GFE02360.1 hypothetical protein KUL156_49520 [Alteromonas sp. KUL156]